MMIDMIGIGDRIKLRRKELGLSQVDIYEKCSISSGALSKIENGKVAPSIIAFFQLSQALECNMEWLATGIQVSKICKIENELLNGFRELTLDSQEEILDIIFVKLRRSKKGILDESLSSKNEAASKMA